MRTMSYDAASSTLSIREGGESKEYGIERCYEEYTILRCYRLHRLTDGGRYFVVVRGDAGECNCKGFQFRSTCRHIDALKKLESLGKLS